MIFSSYVFVFCFLPIVFCGYFLLSKLKSNVYQQLFLIISSLFFYGYFNPLYLIIIIASIIVNYLLAIMIVKENRLKKTYFIVGVLFNILLLGFFKYFDFFISTVNSILASNLRLLHILLPLGISFFTFQQLSFLISIFKNEQKIESFISYSLFVTFFPQLIAGPIVLYSEMIPQFTDQKNRYINLDNILKGIKLFTLGLAKKLILADIFAIFVDNGYLMLNTTLGFLAFWIITLSYTFQIYFDFSGYNDMAIGLGYMFNIKLPTNFNSPYKSKNITEFWRRWHITLGRALTTYVYIPLGGNRKGLVRTCINLFIVFVVSGLWHGAGWTFIVWGMINGICVVIERLDKEKFHKKNYQTKVCTRTKSISQVFLTFILINFMWIFFRAANFNEVVKIFSNLFTTSLSSRSVLEFIVDDGIINFPFIIDIIYLLIYLLIGFIIIWISPNSIEIVEKNKKTIATAIIYSLLFILNIIFMTKVSPFIYFNF